MVDEFRDCFVGEKGYDALKKLMKSGNDLCIDVAKCLQERNDAEIYYTKALRKTSDNLQKFAGRTKGSLAQAFTTLGLQTEKEADAHSMIASVLLNEMAIPMKNLADAQAKERKSIEEKLNKKFKEWNTQKEYDNKYRSRQFEKSREIETLTIKASELSSLSRTSTKSKGGSVSTPLVMGCVFPAGRYASGSEKSASNSDAKHHTHLELSIQKAEEELEKAEKKYHSSTREVEMLRQARDTEMNRCCVELQKMEFNRITEMSNYIAAYATSMQALTDKRHQISQELSAIQISAQNDIIVQARSNVQPAEYEILLYDIYAEKEDNVMADHRRIGSLNKWMEMLRKDIEVQQQTKNENYSLLSSGSRPQKSNEDASVDDDDGAMCSSSSSPSKKDVVRNSIHHRDDSSSSSNDDDGAMHRTKRDKKKSEGIEGFSSEVYIDRRGGNLLEQLYRASLFKIESVYNRSKGLRAPTYEHENLITKTYADKGCPTTFLRLPSQPLTRTPPSAPPAAPAAQQFIQAMPIFVAVPNAYQQEPRMLYTLQQSAPPPPVGWAMNEAPLAYAAPENRSVASSQPMAKSKKKGEFVRAVYEYQAKEKDELSIKPGNIIMVISRREDGWIKGNLDERVGLFPGNYVEDML